MRTNPFLFGLVIVLFLSSVFSVILAARYFFAVVEFERLQDQYVSIRSTLTAAQRLGNDCIIYSRKNPAITSVLFQFTVKRPPGIRGISEEAEPMPELPEGPLPDQPAPQTQPQPK